MTTSEFSNEFDTLIQSYMISEDFRNQNISAFTEYEKSVFLTKAQEEIILEIYKGIGEFNSFESSEESRRLLNSLIETSELDPLTNSEIGTIGDKSYLFSLPENIMFITYEAVLFNDNSITCGTSKYIPVSVISQDEIHKILENPFRKSSKNRVLRLDTKNNTVEIISEYQINKYIIRYLKVPSPILLIDLFDDLSINNVNVKSECLLDKSLHRRILDRAIVLALASKNINK